MISLVEETSTDELVDLYRRHYRSLVRLAALLLDNRAASEEVVQDAFVKLHESWDGVVDPAKRVAYLRSMVLNGARSRGRRRQTRARLRLLPAVDEESAEAGAIRAEEHREVLAALRALPVRQRDCLVLRYYLDLPEAAIAETLGISAGSVKTHTHRGWPPSNEHWSRTMTTEDRLRDASAPAPTRSSRAPMAGSGSRRSWAPLDAVRRGRYLVVPAAAAAGRGCARRCVLHRRRRTAPGRERPVDHLDDAACADDHRRTDSVCALWPPSGRLRDPEWLAEAFAVDFLGHVDPVIKPFRQNEPSAGEIDIHPNPRAGIHTVLSVQRYRRGWVVSSADSPNIELDNPSISSVCRRRSNSPDGAGLSRATSSWHWWNTARPWRKAAHRRRVLHGPRNRDGTVHRRG